MIKNIKSVYRMVLILDLLIYVPAVGMFAALPLFPPGESGINYTSPLELLAAFLAIPVTVLLGLRLVRDGTIRCTRWAYLATVLYGLFVLTGFNSTAWIGEVGIDTNTLITTNMFLLTGIVGAAGGHMVDGGRTTVADFFEDGERRRDSGGGHAS
jgi:hypothetical protein